MKKKLTAILAAAAAAFSLITAAPVLPQTGVEAQAAESYETDEYIVHVQSGYLALRTEQAYDYSNEIGKLYTGDVVEVEEYSSDQYWWVYSPSLDQEGYVNCDYLVPVDSYDGYYESEAMGTATVKVQSGYLALRTARAYDSSNEIGKLYTGDKVYIMDDTYDDYWWVYAPTLQLEGYVNKDYLVRDSSTSVQAIHYIATATVRVESGYLALRNARAYDYSNEIGKLYTGETVYIMDETYSDYWWVYSPKLGKQGYVNKDYLTDISTTAVSSSSTAIYYQSIKIVSVESGYLALRTAPAYDYSNEIGKLYTGDVVYVISYSSSDYWWVYSPLLGEQGYVNCHYLY